jgi:hypothetical protein
MLDYQNLEAQSESICNSLWGYYGIAAVKATVPHIYNIIFVSKGSHTVRLTVVQ